MATPVRRNSRGPELTPQAETPPARLPRRTTGGTPLTPLQEGAGMQPSELVHVRSCMLHSRSISFAGISPSLNAIHWALRSASCRSTTACSTSSSSRCTPYVPESLSVRKKQTNLEDTIACAAERVKVVVRVRPPNPHETAGGVDITDDSSTIILQRK